MRFGVREVMVIAALTFGVLAAGCAAAPATVTPACPSASPQATVADAARTGEFRVCFSKYEYEFYGIDPDPASRLAASKPHVAKAARAEQVCARPAAAPALACQAARSWSPVLPSFFK
jgi:hypothetical protein